MAKNDIFREEDWELIRTEREWIDRWNKVGGENKKRSRSDVDWPQSYPVLVWFQREYDEYFDEGWAWPNFFYPLNHICTNCQHTEPIWPETGDDNIDYELLMEKTNEIK